MELCRKRCRQYFAVGQSRPRNTAEQIESRAVYRSVSDKTGWSLPDVWGEVPWYAPCHRRETATQYKAVLTVGQPRASETCLRSLTEMSARLCSTNKAVPFLHTLTCCFVLFFVIQTNRRHYITVVLLYALLLTPML